MQQLAEYQGYCCVKVMIMDTGKERSEDLADRLGVSQRSITDWRKKVREGDCVCKQLSTCVFR